MAKNHYKFTVPTVQNNKKASMSRPAFSRRIHTKISDESILHQAIINSFFFISQEKDIVGARKNCLSEMVLLSAQSVYLN